jgi:hypothetical protein
MEKKKNAVTNCLDTIYTLSLSLPPFLSCHLFFLAMKSFSNAGLYLDSELSVLGSLSVSVVTPPGKSLRRTNWPLPALLVHNPRPKAISRERANMLL